MKSFLSNVFSSCLGAMFAMVLLFLLVSGMIAALALKDSSKPSVKSQSILKINLQGPIPEQTNNVEIGSFALGNETVLGLRDMVRTIEKAADDPKIRGIYLNVPSVAIGFAGLKELRDALLAFKAKNKFIYSYNAYLDHKIYYLCSASDQISMNPLGFVDLKGLGYAIPHFKELSDKVGISYNIYYAGEFKSATEPYRMNKMSESNRLQIREFLNDLYTEYISEVADSRKIPEVTLKDNFDRFLSYRPELALNYKLIDKLSTESEVLDDLREALQLPESSDLQFITLQQYYLAEDVGNEDYSTSNRIALLFAEGTIVEERGSPGTIGRKHLTMLREIRKNKQIKALVLRVNSPGGSALLSDEFLEELRQIKAAGKPVVVSMGDYAASGGYYISCYADSIITNPYTLTGSIGVFALIPNFSKLSGDLVGVDVDTVGTGPVANKFNLMLPWGEDERKVLEESIQEVYSRFKGVVAAGREMDSASVNKVAAGRIWSGKQALRNGLADATGSIQRALDVAAGLSSLEKYRVSEFPARQDMLQKLMETLKGETDLSESREKGARELLGKWYPVYAQLQVNKEQIMHPQMRLPFTPM
ncbi:MAG: signal peptide peptidase SppA [Saprospiraceae bacterium]|nr:signal peptide peptidase SppA [Saprospiraceae bacterium]